MEKENEYSPIIVTFKFSLPDHDEELTIFANAQKLYSTIHEISQRARQHVKYGENEAVSTAMEEIQQMANQILFIIEG